MGRKKTKKRSTGSAVSRSLLLVFSSFQTILPFPDMMLQNRSAAKRLCGQSYTQTRLIISLPTHTISAEEDELMVEAV
jgi:hypothetical protein